MTLWDFLGLMVRRWPIVLVAALGTGLLGYLTTTNEGVYFSRTQVVFLAPSSRLFPNSLRTTSEDLIITAGIVAKEVTGPGKVLKLASPDATLVGLGVRDGWSIRLPDTGGQWAPNFAQQELYVEVVGPTAAEVEAKRTDLVQQIADHLDQLQRDAGVDPVNDITITVAPEDTVLYHVGGSKIRALAMTAILGAGTTTAVLVLLEQRSRRRQLPGPPTPRPPQPQEALTVP